MDFIAILSIFVLACFVGYFVVWSVTPALHTPLMSVTNAISSVIVVGALLAVSVGLVVRDSGPIWARILGFFALILASVNIFGGFLVTQRMLAMYKKKDWGAQGPGERRGARAGLRRARDARVARAVEPGGQAAGQSVRQGGNGDRGCRDAGLAPARGRVLLDPGHSRHRHRRRRGRGDRA